MIDWVKVNIPIPHQPLSSGSLLMINPDGAMEWERKTWSKLEGSHDSRVRIKTKDIDLLQVDGNLVKFLQGHNVWGTNYLQELIAEFLDRIQPILKTEYSYKQLLSFAKSSTLSRVDVTQSHLVPSYKDAQSAIRTLEQCGHLRHRGKGQMFSDSTVYFGKNSRRWGIKIYHKGAELKSHVLHPQLPFRDSIKTYADKVVRSECVIRQTELIDRDLQKISKWGDNTVADLHAELISKLEITGQIEMIEKEIEKLPPRLIAVYRLWMKGEDIKNIYPSSTFYRYCAELKKYDVDISVPRKQNKERKERTVVDLRRVITLEPAEVPDWAEGTPAYFEPRMMG